MKIDGKWGGGRATAYANMPPHKQTGNVPDGGNNLYADGSVTWVRFEDMYFLHSWNPGGARDAYFYQSPQDFSAQLRAALPRLAAKP